MTRNEVLQDVQETLGSVPGFIAALPDEALPHMWGLLKGVEMSDTLIPGKYKELIGLAVAAALHCPYCTFFHTEAGKLNGADTGEIKEALAMASLTALFSTFLNGAQYDQERFRREVMEVVEAIRRKMWVESPA
ncbi:MAG: carboxymuconolactone decarboxylase family protein [Chloroflexi bacterium]|nr:carboxymuconolactone decarboxylase family protein [Chloroflexota bacterium]